MPRERTASISLRVAFVTVGDTSRLTGGYLYHARVLAGLEKLGCEVEEVVPCGASFEEQEAAGDFALDPSGFDVVVVDMLARVVAALHVGTWRKSLPVVAMVHELPGVAAPENAAGERPFEDALLQVDLVLTVSAHGRSILESRGVPPNRVRVVPPGFDGLTGTEPALSRSATGGGPGSAARALCVAQWVPRKDILGLVEAWRSAGLSNATLRLVGETDADPDYAARVREAISDDASIQVLGKLDDVSLAAVYSEADLFVLPSRYEGYGIVFAEALAAGLPIIARDAGPVPDLVGREAALLAPPEDTGELARALGRLVADEGLRRRMSEAALRRARELPTWKDTIHLFADALEDARKVSRRT